MSRHTRPRLPRRQKKAERDDMLALAQAMDWAAYDGVRLRRYRLTYRRDTGRWDVSRRLPAGYVDPVQIAMCADCGRVTPVHLGVCDACWADHMGAPDDWDDAGVDALDEWDDAVGNCHWTGDAGDVCGAAGSEECDWECPFSGDYHKGIGLGDEDDE